MREWLKLGVASLRKYLYKQKNSAVQYEDVVFSHLRTDYKVLDIGCGASTKIAIKGKCREFIGVDFDQRVGSNPGVDKLVHADISSLPFADNTFDLAISSLVVEHLEEPEACFKEIGRVCKTGAILIIYTPNILHYANWIVKLTPYRIQRWFLKYIIVYKDEFFPTKYRANSPMKLAKMMRSAGFDTIEIRCIDDYPVHLDWCALFYAMGLIYHRLVNRFDKLSFLRWGIIGVFIKEKSNAR